jgi:hypothetical protein
MTEELKILCPFCNAVWDSKMEIDYSISSGSELTGSWMDELKVEIYCSNCGKLVYTKKDS